jgi:hypothetical protein
VLRKPNWRICVSDAVALVVYVFSSMGATILLVWPVDGPGAWIRERIVRRMLPASAGKVLDCYICLSVWIALIGVPFWWMAGYRWCAVAWLVVPAVFWLVMPHSRSGGQ